MRRRRHCLPHESGTPLASEHNTVISVWLLRGILRTPEGEAWLRAQEELPSCLPVQWTPASADGDWPLRIRGKDMCKLKSLLRAGLRRLELRPPKASGAVFRNAERLAERLELRPLERDLLAFAACLERHEELTGFFHGLRPSADRTAMLAAMLDHDVNEVRDALGVRAVLVAAGVVTFPPEIDTEIPFELMPRIGDAMRRDYETADELLQNFFRPSPPPKLTLSDFPHLAAQTRVLVEYLEAVCRGRLAGVNVLLYGPPGTGKTELARTAAAAIDAQLFDVLTEGENGDPRQEDARIDAYRLSQRLLQGTRSSIVLFDEAEDVFPGGFVPFSGMVFYARSRTKGWISRALEENPVPTIWISNAVHQIDPAFLRRFDLAFEVGLPPRSIRRKILESHLGGLPIGAAELDRLAGMKHFSPADAEKTARVLRGLSDLSGPAVDETTRLIVEERLKARGMRPRPIHPASRIPFDLGLINTTADLTALITGLKRRPAGSICLYGPPGTGKTEFAHYLAKVCDLPVHAKRASDLLSMWVGETERLIAKMFDEARQENALLLLDEADSFLQDRRGAQQQWQVTQVNELLVQMENFEGLFVCSTNLIDSLDQASLRRFSFKLKFDYLRPEQRWRMFEAALGALGVPPPTDAERAFAKGRLDALRSLAAGDFAVIAKQNALTGELNTVRALIASLEVEVAAKPEAKKSRIGF